MVADNAACIHEVRTLVGPEVLKKLAQSPGGGIRIGGVGSFAVEGLVRGGGENSYLSMMTMSASLIPTGRSMPPGAP